MIWASALLTSYLLGSIPTGYLMVKALKGIDIRQMGSGNVGATNVIRVLGKGPGILILILDVSKGLLAVLVIALLFAKYLPSSRTELQLGCGIAAICGHNWTCFLRFKGGKGIATSAGVFLGLAPIVMLCLLGIWGIIAFLTRYVSVASIVTSMALPIFLYLFNQPIEWVIAGFILSLVSILKHRSNIKRLLNGTEHRIGEKVSSS
jgi:glycerol-3-phosphate acyltransferase PlsY